MYQYFSREFFVANRKRFRALCATDTPIVLTANGLLQQSNDTTYPFRQDSNFWYVTGINEPDVLVVLDGDQEYILLPEREEIMEIFDGKVRADDLRAISGIDTVLSAEEGWKKLTSRLRRTKQVATIQPPAAYIEDYDFYTNPARAHMVQRMQDTVPGLELVNIQQHFIAMRMIKQAPELQAIQRAVDTTVRALTTARTARLAHEYEYEAMITAAFRSEGTGGHGYQPIVAAGAHACTLHHMDNNGVVQKNDMVLFDVGAQVEYYNADITRTYAYGRPTKRQQAVHQAVLEAQVYGFSLMKPGNTVRDNERQIETFIGQKLQELGVIKKPDRDNIRAYYPHALSHALGLDVHDAADYTRPFEPGMVFTVEPGIYISEEGIGVRIEDDVVITETGCTILSDQLPRDLIVRAES